MLGNENELPNRFSHKAAQSLADFMRSMNMATQAFAIDGANAENVQTTGTAACVINGVHINSLTADAELDISADLQLTTWLTATAYTAVDVRYVEDANGDKVWYKCIASHTSSASTKPGQPDHINATWRNYWTESTNRAEQASGDVVADTYSRYYLCLANSAGTITLVKAGDVALDADVELQIPHFDPAIFVAIGTLLVDSAGFTMGTTALTSIGTFAQLIGPVFPNELYLDKN
jgi:hypothetical protein